MERFLTVAAGSIRRVIFSPLSGTNTLVASSREYLNFKKINVSKLEIAI